MRIAGTFLVIAFLLAGCGGNQASPMDSAFSDAIQAADDLPFADAELTLSTHCVRMLKGVETTRGLVRADRAVAFLIGEARKRPDYRYDGRTLTQVLSDEASDLEACDPALTDRLDRAVGTL